MAVRSNPRAYLIVGVETLVIVLYLICQAVDTVPCHGCREIKVLPCGRELVELENGVVPLSVCTHFPSVGLAALHYCVNVDIRIHRLVVCASRDRESHG